MGDTPEFGAITAVAHIAIEGMRVDLRSCGNVYVINLPVVVRGACRFSIMVKAELHVRGISGDRGGDGEIECFRCTERIDRQSVIRWKAGECVEAIRGDLQNEWGATAAVTRTLLELQDGRRCCGEIDHGRNQ